MFALAANCRTSGASYYAISGYRSFPEQMKLWTQGRTVSGKIVTNALPGSSYHNYGLAVDWCKDKDATREGLQPGWGRRDYVVLADEAEKLGLEPGLRFRHFVDAPHVQMNLASRSVDLSELKALHDLGGLEMVWKYLDKKGPWF